MCLPVFVVMEAFPSYGLVECMRVHVSACECMCFRNCRPGSRKKLRAPPPALSCKNGVGLFMWTFILFQLQSLCSTFARLCFTPERLVQRHANRRVQSRAEEFEVKTSVLQSKTSQRQVLSSVFLKYKPGGSSMWINLSVS